MYLMYTLKLMPWGHSALIILIFITLTEKKEA